MMKSKIIPVIPGILAFLLSFFYPIFDALFLSLLFGIVAGSFFKSENLRIIAEEVLSITLPTGIVLYGFRARIPTPTLPIKVVILTTFSAFIMGLFVYLFARLMNVDEKLSLLLACGTSICGASAITILSSIVKPKKEDFSVAIIVITIVGLTGVIVYPAFWHIFNLSFKEYSLLCGATLHQTGLVESATEPFGSTIVREALAVKGIRIALISVVALIASFFYSEKRFYIPWYIFAFLVVSVLSSFMIPSHIVRLVEPLSTLAFSITLSCIGFCVSISDVQKAGIKPLLVSYLGWFFALSIFFLALISTY